MADTNNSNWQTDDNPLETENITSSTPRALVDSIVWRAIREALSTSHSAPSALDKVMKWNEKNSPRIPDKSLLKKFEWALKNFDDVPFPRKL